MKTLRYITLYLHLWFIVAKYRFCNTKHDEKSGADMYIAGMCDSSGHRISVDRRGEPTCISAKCVEHPINVGAICDARHE